MRLFQMMGLGPDYLNDFSRRHPKADHLGYAARKELLLQDRYGAPHILKPVYSGDTDCFFTVCDDPVLQNAWAKENNFRSTDLYDIVLAQIEQHKTEILYNNNPIGFPSSFVKRLPSNVKKAIAWRAAPVGNFDLSAYDAIVSNFHTLNRKWREYGWNARYFSPSWDPGMLGYGNNTHREIDIFFAGSYSRTTGHDGRLALLDVTARLDPEFTVNLHLLHRQWGRLADKAPWRWVPMPILLPRILKRIARKPLYGVEQYKSISNSKIVINPATDIAGNERGNMRCWEALGCGACMLASEGSYPEGFIPDVNFVAFKNLIDLKNKLYELLADPQRRENIAEAGFEMVKRVWSKDRQWSDFIEIVRAL